MTTLEMANRCVSIQNSYSGHVTALEMANRCVFGAPPVFLIAQDANFTEFLMHQCSKGAQQGLSEPSQAQIDR